LPARKSTKAWESPIGGARLWLKIMIEVLN
jgi:hypothetical protein